MSNTENQASSFPSPSKGEKEQLLKELMPQLELEAGSGSGRYRAKAWIKYLLPKVLAVCLTVAALVCLAIYIFTPAKIYNMEVADGAGQVAVKFNVDKVLLLESVTAELDGSPIEVLYETVGTYKIDVDKNGALAISARTFTGRSAESRVAVDSIDEEPPHISDHELADGNMTIHFTDGNGTGIDWSTLHAEDAASGEPFEIPEVDEGASLISFPLPESSVRIYLDDNNGNPLAVLLELVEKNKS